MQLGVRAIRYSAPHRMAAHALLEELPPPPAAVDHRDGRTGWGVMLNDQLGDCTIAGLAHSIQVATLNARGGEVTPPDAVVLQGYEQLCGYDPTDPATDQGGVELDVLDLVKARGFAGQRLLGYVSPDPRNLDHVRKAIAYFRSVYVGAALPLSAQQQGGVWTVAPGRDGVAGGWGGHCMVGAAYDVQGLPWITWGLNQDADWAWFQAYVQEVHVLLWEPQLQQFPAATQETLLDVMRSLQ